MYRLLRFAAQIPAPDYASWRRPVPAAFVPSAVGLLAGHAPLGYKARCLAENMTGEYTRARHFHHGVDFSQKRGLANACFTADQ